MSTAKNAKLLVCGLFWVGAVVLFAGGTVVAGDAPVVKNIFPVPGGGTHFDAVAVGTTAPVLLPSKVKNDFKNSNSAPVYRSSKRVPPLTKGKKR